MPLRDVKFSRKGSASRFKKLKFRPKPRAAIGSLEFLPRAVSEQANALKFFLPRNFSPSCFASKIRVFAGDKAKMKDKFYDAPTGIFSEYKAGVK